MTRATQCRVCASPISPFMSFGRMPIANGFLTPEQFAKEYFFEMAPSFCERCHAFQLVEQPDPEMMFHENYAFFSGTSRAMGAHFGRYAEDVRRRFLTGPDPFVVEIGSNDGIMLRHFAASRTRHLGVEPSANVAEAARQAGVETVCAFFGEKTARDIMAKQGPADAILSANVMCHIPDLNSVARGVTALLKPNGVFVFEDPYLGDVVEKTSYDQIYDEHVYLFSVRSVANAFRPHGLEVIAVAHQPTHGGSMRYMLARAGQRPVEESVAAQLAIEDGLGLGRPETFDRFRRACEASRDALIGLLEGLRVRRRRVVGYAATSKSTTITQYCGITPDHLAYISDTTPIKQGKFSPGAHIPVVSDAEFHRAYPDYALLFAWNHAREIGAKETGFLDSGGKWILHVPEVRVAWRGLTPEGPG